MGGKHYAKLKVFKCQRCFHCNPETKNIQMSNLLIDRVTQAMPFQLVGNDYAGPLLIKTKMGRGARNAKYCPFYFLFWYIGSTHRNCDTLKY